MASTSDVGDPCCVCYDRAVLSPGATVDRYTVLHEVGQGGAARVYAVQHTLLGTWHALKVPHGQASFDVDSLVREGRLQAHLDAAHVVPITDVVRVAAGWGLLMPLVAGCSLSDLLATVRPSLEETSALLLDVLEGIATAHQAGVVHRDLKPGNVLLEVTRGRLVARVTDFGIALKMDQGTSQGGFRGTPAYAAPEQLDDADSVTASADLWSVGVMAYEMLTGRRPFLGKNVRELRQAHAEGPALDVVPEVWRGVIEGLLRIDPQGRTSPVDAVREALLTLGFPREVPLTSPVAQRVLQQQEARPRGLQVQPSSIAVTLDPTEGASRSLRQRDLPRPRDVFVGRREERASLSRLLDTHRVVTVLGMGGIGKTRLALQMGWEEQAAFEGGVWFCDLSEARTEDGLVRALAGALEVPVGPGDGIAQLGRAMATLGEALVILDNFEQLVPFAEATVQRWADLAPHASFLVTSREVLGLRQEAVLPLPPLPAAAAQELLMERAAAAASLDPDSIDEGALQQLVATLDGLPLAIELAAARLRVLQPAQMVKRMSERFKLLVSASGRPDRHATLRATLDWSWQLLDDSERQALVQLSVFAGPFRLEEMEAVLVLTEDAPWLLDVLQALVDKSWVRPLGDGWFSLLASVRDYALQAPTEADLESAEQRHGAFFAALGEQAALDSLDLADGRHVRRLLKRHVDNLFAACRRAVTRGEASVAGRAALAAWAAVEPRGPYQDGVDLLESALSTVLAAEPDTLTVRVLDRCGFAHQLVGDRQRAALLMQQAHDLATELGEDLLAAVVQANRAGLSFRTGDRAAAWTQLQAAIEALEAASDQGRLGHARSMRASLLAERGEGEAARAEHEAALQIHRAVGNRRGESYALQSLGMLHFGAGRLREAVDCDEAALAGFVEMGDLRGEALVLGNLGLARSRLGELHAAVTALHGALQMHRRMGRRDLEGVVLKHLANLAMQQLQGERALTLHREAVAIQREVGRPRSLAIALRAMGALHVVRGEWEEAEPLLDEALAIDERIQSRRGLRHGWVQLARLYRLTDRVAAAGELLQRALSADRAAGHRWGEGVVLAELGLVHLAMQPAQAEALLREALAIHEEVGNVVGEGAAVAVLAGSVDDAAAVARLDEAVSRIREGSDPVQLGLALCVVSQRRGDGAALREAVCVAEGLGARPRSELGVRIAALQAREPAGGDDADE
ncbi:MAG: tetratricopeptide repeat protein [Myxococcales bacterium]|nr:tetratricopeptide repeat protein [Myxococcales bacterium]